MQIAQQCPCFGVGLNLLVFIQSQSHRHAYYNPLTPKICLLILASNCYTFPCNLVARIWCQIKWNGYCGGEVTCESLLGVKGLRLALHATLLVNPYRKKKYMQSLQCFSTYHDNIFQQLLYHCTKCLQTRAAI